MEQKILERSKNQKIESAERIKQRADDDLIVEIVYRGKSSNIYINYIKSGLIFYTIEEYGRAKECFMNAYNYLKKHFDLVNKDNKFYDFMMIFSKNKNKKSTDNTASIYFNNLSVNVMVLTNACDRKMNNQITFTLTDKRFTTEAKNSLERCSNFLANMEMQNDLYKSINHALDIIEFEYDYLNPENIISMISSFVIVGIAYIYCNK